MYECSSNDLNSSTTSCKTKPLDFRFEEKLNILICYRYYRWFSLVVLNQLQQMSRHFVKQLTQL